MVRGGDRCPSPQSSGGGGRRPARLSGSVAGRFAGGRPESGRALPWVRKRGRGFRGSGLREEGLGWLRRGPFLPVMAGAPGREPVGDLLCGPPSSRGGAQPGSGLRSAGVAQLSGELPRSVDSFSCLGRTAEKTGPSGPAASVLTRPSPPRALVLVETVWVGFHCDGSRAEKVPELNWQNVSARVTTVKTDVKAGVKEGSSRFGNARCGDRGDMSSVDKAAHAHLPAVCPRQCQMPRASRWAP